MGAVRNNPDYGALRTIRIIRISAASSSPIIDHLPIIYRADGRLGTCAEFLVYFGACPSSSVRNPAIGNAALNTLRVSAWEGPQTTDWGHILARSLGWVCAFDHDALVGFVNLAWDGGQHAFLLDTTVHAAYQRRGIGARLVREAAALALEAGVTWLHVDYEAALEPFYAAGGFRPTSAALLRLDGGT